MERHFDEELAALKGLVVDMCGLTEELVAMAVRALVERNVDLLQGISEQEQKIDRFQIDVDEVCCRLIALHQPTARDLRFLFGVAKINNEIERIADQGVSIAGFTRPLLQDPPLKPFEAIPRMVQMAVEMMRESIHAFVNLDARRARQVIQSDDSLDDLNKKVILEIIRLMKEDREAVERGVRLILVSKKLERIGDLACNIAEDVVFMAEGEDVRHREDERL
jgi:phosphate transport system protein